MALYGGVTVPGKPDLDNTALLDRLPIPMISEMHRYGIAVDREYLWELEGILSKEADNLQRDISSYVPKDKLDEFSDKAAEIEENSGSATINANSADQIRELLFSVLGLGRKIELKKSVTGKIKTDKKQLAEIEEEHPVVKLIQEYRERKKLITTYCRSLPKKAVFHPRSNSCPVCGLRHWVDTWRIHTTFSTTRTETRRLACVHADTPVNTRRGIVPMKYVVVGDYVWTHRNRWRRVTATWIKGMDVMYRVTFCNGNTLICTGDHSVLTYDYVNQSYMDPQSQKHQNGTGFIQESATSFIERDSGEVRNYLSQCTVCGRSSLTGSGTQSTVGYPVREIQEGREESYVREDGKSTSQLDRFSGRWKRISDLFERRRTPICTPYRNGRGAGYAEVALSPGCTPYRRQQEEQSIRQFSAGYSPWTSNSAQDSGIYTTCIQAVELVGQEVVYDISVDEDESYEACGVFNHNSRKPNLQNIPQRTELGQIIRAAFMATPGTKLVSNDFGQIELVDLANLAKCRGMIAVYNVAGDLHLYTASECFGVPQDKVDKVSQRIPAKTVNFAIVYGISPKALSAQLRYFFSTLLSENKINKDKYHALIAQWSEVGCKTLIDKWFGIYPEVLEFMELQAYRARRYGFVWDVFGGVRIVPEIYSSLPYIQGAGIRQAGNMPIQCIMGNMRVFKYGVGVTTLDRSLGPARLWDGRGWSSGTVVETGRKKLCRVYTHDGACLECSPDHKLLIRTPNVERWMTVKELYEVKRKASKSTWNNYRVALVDHTPLEWGSRKLPNHIDAKWWGRIASDGYAMLKTGGGGEVRLIVAEHESDLLSYLECGSGRASKAKYKTTMIKPTKTNATQKVYTICTHDVELVRYLVSQGVKGKLPDDVQRNKLDLSGYLSGLFDGDGTVAKDGVILAFGGGDRYLPWAQDIRVALLMYGIRSRVYNQVEYRAVRVKVMKSDVPQFNNAIGMMSARKREKLENFNSGTGHKGNASYGWAVGIAEIEITSKLESMYDFVDSSSGRFAAEGLIVHNSTSAGQTKLVMGESQELLSNLRTNQGMWAWPLLVIHDQIMIEVEERYADEVGEAQRELFTQVMIDRETGESYWQTPITADTEINDRWMKG